MMTSELHGLVLWIQNALGGNAMAQQVAAMAAGEMEEGEVVMASARHHDSCGFYEGCACDCDPETLVARLA